MGALELQLCTQRGHRLLVVPPGHALPHRRHGRLGLQLADDLPRLLFQCEDASVAVSDVALCTSQISFHLNQNRNSQ